jgi:hypothetical protein
LQHYGLGTDAERINQPSNHDFERVCCVDVRFACVAGHLIEYSNWKRLLTDETDYSSFFLRILHTKMLLYVIESSQQLLNSLFRMYGNDEGMSR